MNGHLRATLAEGRHAYTLRVYYEDTDAGGVVYHASYLRFAERARTEALRDLGIPHAALVARFALMFVVRRIKVDYLRPARVDESLTVTTESLAVGGASVVLRQEVRGGAGTCAVLEVQLACVPPNGDKPARLPAEWRRALVAMRDARAGRDATTGHDTKTGYDTKTGHVAKAGREMTTGCKAANGREATNGRQVTAGREAATGWVAKTGWVAQTGRGATIRREATTRRDARGERHAMTERAARTGDKRGSAGGSGG